MDFSKWRPQILHDIRVFIFFHNYDVFFGKIIFFPEFTFCDPISFRY